MEITLRDAAIVSGLVATWIGIWIGARKRATELAVWRSNQDRNVEGLSKRLDIVDSRLSKHSEKDEAVLRALNELRVVVARLESKIDRRNGAE